MRNNIYYIYDNYDELMTEANRIVNVVKRYLEKEIITLEEPITLQFGKNKFLKIV